MTSAAATVAAILLSSSVITALVTAWMSRRGNEASAAEILVRTSTDLLEPMREQIADLRAAVQVLTEQVAQARAETELCHQEREADRSRIQTLELEVAHYKAGSDAFYNTEDGKNPWRQD